MTGLPVFTASALKVRTSGFPVEDIISFFTNQWVYQTQKRKRERKTLRMDESVVLWEFLLFISSSQLFQHSRLGARALLKAWAVDGSISLLAPSEALDDESDERGKNAPISSPACDVMKTWLIKWLSLTGLHTSRIPTVRFWAQSDVCACLRGSLRCVVSLS